MSLSEEFNPRNGDDFEAGVPNRAKRSKSRPVPRAADHAEIDAALRSREREVMGDDVNMKAIVDAIVARDSQGGKLRWR